MKVRIANLPSNVTEDDLRELLGSSDELMEIEIFSDGDSDSPVAVIETDSDAAGEGVARMIDGRNWKGVTLRAAKLLY